jgi:hypothetical protein
MELEKVFKDSKDNIGGPLLKYFQELKAQNALKDLNMSIERAAFDFAKRNPLNPFIRDSGKTIRITIDFVITKVIFPPTEIRDFFFWQDQIYFDSNGIEQRGRFVFETDRDFGDFN